MEEKKWYLYIDLIETTCDSDESTVNINLFILTENKVIFLY